MSYCLHCPTLNKVFLLLLLLLLLRLRLLLLLLYTNIHTFALDLFYTWPLIGNVHTLVT